MHLGLGFSGRGRAGAPQPSIVFNLSEGTPSGLTFSRASAATYRDSSGVWRSAASGTARNGSAAHYPEGSEEGFFWMEPQITNKITSRNANPTDTTGWSKTGDAASVLDDVTAPGSSLTDAGLHVLCSSGKVLRLDNAGGATAANAESTAQFGSTSQHVISAWIYVVSGTATLTRTGGGTPETKVIAANSGFVRHALKVVPNATTDLMKISISAGGDVYFILEQVEQHTFVDEEGGGVPTSPIVTSAATATRNVDRMYTLSLASADWFNASEGALVFDFYPVAYGGATIQYLFSFANGSATSGGSANYHSARINNDKGYTRTNVVAGGAAATQVATDKPRLRFRSGFAYTWKNGENSLVSPVVYTTISGYTEPTGPYDRLEIGKFHATTFPFFGGIKSVAVYDVHRETGSLISGMLTADDRAIIVMGQSNGYGAFRSDDGQDNTGQRRAYAVLDAYQADMRNWLVNGCTNGAALLEDNDGGTGYYIDDGGVEGEVVAYGSAWNNSETMMRGWMNSPAQISCFAWDQGDSGINAVPGARHRAALLRVAGAARGVCGAKPFLLAMKGRRGDSVQTQPVRDVYHDLEGEYEWMHLSPEFADLTLSDLVHYAETNGYDKYYERVARKVMSILGDTVSGGVDGPRISGASRSGTTVTVTLVHDGGTDITPTTGIQGFYFYDDTSPIAVTAGVRTNATTITLTLASAPVSGMETLYHYYSGMNGLSAASLIRDNSIHGLPLRSARISL